MPKKPTYEELERQNIELKQQNDSLNRYYRSVVDNSMDAILLTAPDGNVFFANQAACDLFQMTQQEIIDGGRMAVLDEEDDKLPEALEKRKKTGKFVGELNFKKKDGTLFTGEVSSAIYKDTEGQTLTSIIIRDVTERKTLEEALHESENLYRLLAENSTDLITMFKNQDMVYVSPTIEIILGYSPDEFMRINHTDLFYPDDKAYLVESMNTRIATMDTRPITYEYRQKHKKGHYVWLETTVKNKIIENGYSISVLNTRDITERKKTEKALRDSEEKYRKLYEDAAIGIFHSTFDGRFLDVNPALAKMLGYETPQEVVESIYSIPEQIYVEPQVRDEVVAQSLAKGETVKVENRYRRKDGSEWIAHLHLRYVSDVNGQPICLEGFVEDITERKKTEEALKDSEERHRLFYNPSFGGSVIHDKGIILDCSNGVTNITGYSHDELIGMDGLLLMAPDWRDFVKDKIASGFEEPYEAEGIRKDGTIFPLRLHAKTIQYRGKPARVVEFRDITEIKKKEEEIQAAREFLDTVIDLSLFGMWVSDKEGTVIRANRSLCETMNLTEDKIVGKYNVFRDDNLKAQGVMPKVTSVFEKHQPARFTIPWQAAGVSDVDFRTTRDIYIDVYMFPILDAQGDLKNVVCQWLDITERKLAEEKLQESERKYRNIAESMPGMILKYKLNPDGSDQLLYISKGVDDLYEIQREDAVKNNTLLWDRVHKDDLEEFNVSVKKSAENLSFWELEHRLKMPDGRVKWVRNRGVPNKQEDGSVVWDSLAVDITERKQAEQALKESENLLRNIIDSSTDYIFVKDKNLKTILCNKVFAQAVNKKPSDLIGKTDIENGWDAELVKGNPEKGIIGYEKDDLAALSGKIVQNTDTATVSGKTLFLDSIKIPLKDENDKVFGILGVSRDITERKRLESEKDRLIDELKLALAKVKKLEGFLPICSYCKKIRDDLGYWQQIEKYIHDRSDAQFSHGICPECAKEHFPDMNLYDD